MGGARKAIKVLTVLGTRPEAIKLAPVIKELEAHRGEVTSLVCVTAQHREMLDPFLRLFGIRPDWDLNIMRPGQSLYDVTVSALNGLREVIESAHPDLVLVQGDTTTAFVAALSAFYEKTPVAHVEAGLRSHDKYNPFPEEINRRLADVLSDLYFAPTEAAKENLLREGVAEERITVTGNTVIDALFFVLEKTRGDQHPLPFEPRVGHRLILVTGHRRESFGPGLESICAALRRIAEANEDVEIVYPVHLNPNVREPVRRILQGAQRVHLVEPLDYVPFVRLMSRAYLILTDSGGIQEEAPSLNVPVLVMRKTTERPEGIEVGAAKLVGTEADSIYQATQRLLDDEAEYRRMASAPNPYGDGRAGRRIVEVIRTWGKGYGRTPSCE